VVKPPPPVPQELQHLADTFHNFGPVAKHAPKKSPFLAPIALNFAAESPPAEDSPPNPAKLDESLVQIKELLKTIGTKQIEALTLFSDMVSETSGEIPHLDPELQIKFTEVHNDIKSCALDFRGIQQRSLGVATDLAGYATRFSQVILPSLVDPDVKPSVKLSLMNKYRDEANVKRASAAELTQSYLAFKDKVENIKRNIKDLQPQLEAAALRRLGEIDVKLTELDANIKTWETVLAVALGAVGVGVFVGLVGVWLLFIPGAQVFGVALLAGGVIGALGGVGTAIAAAVKLKNFRDEKDSLNAEKTQINEKMDGFRNAVTKLGKVLDGLTSIVETTTGFEKIWNYIISQIDQVIASYNAIIKNGEDEFTQDWLKILNRDLAVVQKYWNTVSEVMDLYVVNFGALPGIP